MSCSPYDGPCTPNISDQGLYILHSSVYCMSHAFQTCASQELTRNSFYLNASLRISLITRPFFYKQGLSRIRGTECSLSFFYRAEESQQSSLSVNEGACMLR